jgi:hypothetical protein
VLAKQGWVVALGRKYLLTLSRLQMDSKAKGSPELFNKVTGLLNKQFAERRAAEIAGRVGR